MIISHKHKFIFIKTKKTAGTSIEIALSSICGEHDIITPISKQDEIIRKELGFRGAQNYIYPFKFYSKKDWLRLLYYRKRHGFYNHIPAKDIKEHIDPLVWESYFKFTFERNPFDKIISWYYFAGQKFDTILDFIKSGQATEVSKFDLYTINSIPIVDKIYKFEELENALIDISKKLALDEPLKLPKKKAKGKIRLDKRHYSEILQEEEVTWIAKIFAREIAFFGYSF